MGLDNGEEYMNYNIDYFKSKNRALFPQLTLTGEEYLEFVEMCRYLDLRLRGCWSYFVFANTDYGMANLVLNNQLISSVISKNEDVIVIEKFYNKIYFKYLEEKLKELTITEHVRDPFPSTQLSPPLECEHCRQYHNNQHMPVISGWR